MTPEQEEQVRRALADAAREPTPMPPHVVGRMDEVLADLVSARDGDLPEESLGRTDDRRAPRGRWALALAAAAAVCLVALGGSAILRAVTSGEPGAASSASASRTVTEQGQASGEKAEAALPPQRLHRATLQGDVRRVLATVPLSGGPRASGHGQKSLQGLAEQPRNTVGCATPSEVGNADVVDVLLDGRPATLVASAPRGGTREVRVYSCRDASVPVATTRVRVR